jgi:pimeloyl-ACP methyl ester carboxylesterase
MEKAPREVRMVDGVANIDGRRLRYSVSDNLDASTWALNLHGYMAGGGVYWRESSRLAGRLGLRVINPNLPGFGGSEPLPWERLQMATFAEGLTRLLDHLGASTALVLGHSMGAAVAVQFAHDFPERTLGVVYRDGVATSSWKHRHGLWSRLLGPLVPDLGTALDFLSAFATDLPDLALSRITSLVATAAPDLRLNARSFTSTLPVAAMLMACDFTEIAAAVGKSEEIPILPMWGRFDRLVPPATGREFGELVGRPVQWVLGGHSWMIPRPATQLNVLRHDEPGLAFMEQVRDRARLLKRPAA